MMNFNLVHALTDGRHRELLQEAERGRVAAQAMASAAPRSSVAGLLRWATHAARAVTTASADVRGHRFDLASNIPPVRGYPVARRR